MLIDKTVCDGTLTLSLEGRLDSNTSIQLESELKHSIDGLDLLILDFSSLKYLSSAGLRVILVTQRKMEKQGKMVIRNSNQAILDMFEYTGLIGILNLE